MFTDCLCKAEMPYYAAIKLAPFRSQTYRKAFCGVQCPCFSKQQICEDQPQQEQNGSIQEFRALTARPHERCLIWNPISGLRVRYVFWSWHLSSERADRIWQSHLPAGWSRKSVVTVNTHVTMNRLLFVHARVHINHWYEKLMQTS